MKEATFVPSNRVKASEAKHRPQGKNLFSIRVDFIWKIGRLVVLGLTAL